MPLRAKLTFSVSPAFTGLDLFFEGKPEGFAPLQHFIKINKIVAKTIQEDRGELTLKEKGRRRVKRKEEKKGKGRTKLGCAAP